MKNKLNLDELKVKSFVTAEEATIKETVKGGGNGPWSYPCPYHTEVKGCDEQSAWLTCVNTRTEVVICGQLTEKQNICNSVSGGGWW